MQRERAMTPSLAEKEQEGGRKKEKLLFPQRSEWRWRRGGEDDGGGAGGGVPLWRGCQVRPTLTLVQLVLFHDVVLQLRGQLLLLLLDRGGLPAVLLVQLPSDPVSSSASPRPPVRVHVVAQDGRLDQLCGGVGRRLAPRPQEAALLQVGAVEGLHLIDLVGQVYVSVEPRLGHSEIGLLVFHLVVIIGDAVGWRT